VALHNFSWVIPGKLAGVALPGGYPGAPDKEVLSDLRDLHRKGIRCLVSAQRVPAHFASLTRQVGLEWMHHPIEDFSVPHDPVAFESLVDDCIERISRAQAVSVHCRAGIGRTGLVLACVVGRMFGISGTQALRTVRKTRMALDTEEQAAFVRDFCARP